MFTPGRGVTSWLLALLLAVAALLLATTQHATVASQAQQLGPTPSPATISGAPARKLGIQGGWAIDDAGSLDFPHSLRSQLILIRASRAGVTSAAYGRSFSTMEPACSTRTQTAGFGLAAGEPSGGVNQDHRDPASSMSGPGGTRT